MRNAYCYHHIPIKSNRLFEIALTVSFVYLLFLSRPYIKNIGFSTISAILIYSLNDHPVTSGTITAVKIKFNFPVVLNNIGIPIKGVKIICLIGVNQF